MQNDGVKLTLSSVLKCCSSLSELSIGKGVHGWIVRSRVAFDVVLENSLLDFYVKCENFGSAKRLFELMEERNTVEFKDVASWNTIINGVMRNGFETIPLELLYEMVNKGTLLNEVTFSIALALVSSFIYLEFGKQIHGRVLRLGIHVDGFTITSIVSACANSVVLKLGQQVHAVIQKIGHKVDAYLGSSLIDMYAKCGNLDDAQMIFKQTNDMNVVLCTSMISICALHG
ncbi:hypothetical protein REPUB_Repub06bG0096200 [Reevesia pubescens]